MASAPPTIDHLPNEILMHILSPFPTPSLLPLALVSRRFQAITVRLLHARLAHAAALPGQELILECYHPSAKISTPYLHCEPLGMTELGEEDVTLRGLHGLYSRFRPVTQEENRRGRARYPPGSGGSGGLSAGAVTDDGTATQDVFLDEGELFSQLCTVTNLVKVGRRHGLFLSHVNVSDGLVRVWRNWLATQAGARPDGEERILWADARQNVGLRFRVREDRGSMPPVLVASDEDVPVNYTLEYEELLVRTSQLLLMVEQSEAQEVTHSGLGYIVEKGAKIPCQGEILVWPSPPQPGDWLQRQWGAVPVAVGGF